MTHFQIGLNKMGYVLYLYAEDAVHLTFGKQYSFDEKNVLFDEKLMLQKYEFILLSSIFGIEFFSVDLLG